uniref:GST N-terminal domain-containing protein n=1 Tax=Hanusia phi TaxID=3032 RepID=A0A7S0NE46_9CRYP|mmetsp:Transcript_8014/g.18284  ORF Transcript_8014/g.18284 Transcript_8014/m.18284 type:complete len:257 (+) Transcript_8014:152-922(+)
MAETITNLDWQPNNEGQDLPQPLPITRKDQINHVKLYEIQASPPCVMVRALLAYGDIKYESVMVNMMSKKELKWSTYRKIPILVINGMQINDSYIIYKELCSIVFGRTLSETEAQQIHDITYGMLLAFQSEFFGSPVVRKKFVRLSFAGNCCFACLFHPCIRMYVGRAPNRIHAAHPELQSFDFYGKRFRSEFRGTYHCGVEPGPVDIMVWALTELGKHMDLGPGIDRWIAACDLTEWYQAINGLMQSKQSLWWEQ